MCTANREAVRVTGIFGEMETDMAQVSFRNSLFPLIFGAFVQIEERLLSISDRLYWLISAYRNRSEVRNLLHVDDRTLADIGLSRADVMAALESRFDRDPSADLARCRDVKRQAQTRLRQEVKAVWRSPSAR